MCSFPIAFCDSRLAARDSAAVHPGANGSPGSVNLDNIKVAALKTDWFDLESLAAFMELTTRGCPGSWSDSATSRPFLNSYSPAIAAEMIKRRLRQAGLPEHYSAHSFRAAGVTNFPENGGSLEVAQRIAEHADSHTTKLYDRRAEKLRDLDDSAVIEATCMRCLHVWLQSPVQLLIKIDHRGIYLDEVAQHLACPKPGCRHIGVRLTMLKNEDTSGFIGGMP